MKKIFVYISRNNSDSVLFQTYAEKTRGKLKMFSCSKSLTRCGSSRQKDR